MSSCSNQQSNLLHLVQEFKNKQNKETKGCRVYGYDTDKLNWLRDFWNISRFFQTKHKIKQVYEKSHKAVDSLDQNG